MTAPPAERVVGPLERAGMVVLALLVIAPVVLGVALFTVLSLALTSCGGDGGEPYYEPDSSFGRFCESAASEVVFDVLTLLPPVLAIVLGVVAAVRGRWRWVLASLLVPLGVVLLGVAVISAAGG